MIDDLKGLRIELDGARTKIDFAWGLVPISADHYLSESLADLIIKLDETKDLVNQMIGERIE